MANGSAGARDRAFLFTTSPGYFAQAAFYFITDERNPSLMRARIKDLSIQLGEGLAGLMGRPGIQGIHDAWKIAIDRPLVRHCYRYGSGEKAVARNRWGVPKPAAQRTPLAHDISSRRGGRSGKP